MRPFLIITPEYPPNSGGVGDYTRQVAIGLVGRGASVSVYTPKKASAPLNDAGVQVQCLPDRFGWRSVRLLEEALSRQPDSTILLQYVPQPFGLKGLNLPFFTWLCLRRAPLWIMFHEVVFPFVARQPKRHRLLAVGTRVTLSLLGTRADRSFVSIPAWARYLERWARTRQPPVWAPVPSNLPLTVRCPRAEIRARFGMTESNVVLTSFGTFSEAIAAPLCEAVPRLLGERSERRFLLIGKGSPRLAQRLGGDPRIVATGAVDAEDAADLLAAADLGVFPFHDGASSRRTSLMAALALGLPVVTTHGHLSEPVWRESGAVGIAAAGDTGALSSVAEELLADPAARARLGERGRSLYRGRFGLDRALDLLLSESPRILECQTSGSY